MTNPTLSWKYQNPTNPKLVEFAIDGSDGLFNTTRDSRKRFVIVNTASNQLPPVKLTRLGNQNIHGQATPELLIITDPEFRDQAERLAELRQSHDGISAFSGNHRTSL